MISFEDFSIFRDTLRVYLLHSAMSDPFFAFTSQAYVHELYVVKYIPKRETLTGVTEIHILSSV